MSTRAFIARKWCGNGGPINSYDGMCFKGRYHHFDGYPTGLGEWLFTTLKTEFGGNLKLFLYLLLDTETSACGWSNVQDSDLLLEAVSPEEHMNWWKVIQRHKDMGDYETWKLTPDGRVAEKSPVAYSKRTEDYKEESWEVNELNSIDSWMEWGYIFDVEKNVMYIYELYNTPKKVAEVDLTADGFDFAALEKY